MRTYRTLKDLDYGKRMFGIDRFDMVCILLFALVSVRVAGIIHDKIIGGYVLIGFWIFSYVLYRIDKKFSAKHPEGAFLHLLTHNDKMIQKKCFSLEPMPDDIKEYIQKKYNDQQKDM